MFRKIMLSSVAAIALPAAAFSADLPVKAYAPAAAVYNWTGFYIGGSAGAALHEAKTDFSAADALDTGYSGNPINNSKIGGIVGGQVGYNYQIRNFVIGAEGDISWLGGLGRTGIGAWPDCTTGYCTATAQTDATALATIRARAGIDFSGTLVYGTAGIGWLKLKDNFNVGGVTYDYNAGSLTGPAKGGNFASSKWAPAFVVGGGIEQMITPNWSVKGEVLWVKTETTDAGPTDTHYFNAANLGTGLAPVPPVNYTHQLTIGRIGLNYRFN
jgi:outer membrane immunogenic protein